jgi:hypothetical protein
MSPAPADLPCVVCVWIKGYASEPSTRFSGLPPVGREIDSTSEEHVRIRRKLSRSHNGSNVVRPLLESFVIDPLSLETCKPLRKCLYESRTS